MDIRQLNALVGIADHGGFSAAAHALHTVQSNVSAHIAHLEQDLGLILVDRARRSLTPEGQIVANRARRIQVELQGIADDIASIDDRVAGEVRIGIIGTSALWIVPRLLRLTERRHPDLRIVVVDAPTSSIAVLMDGNHLELAMVVLPFDDPTIETEPLFTEENVLMAPIGHELGRRDSVTLEELAGHELLLPPRGTTYRDQIDADAAQAGVELTVTAEIDGLRLLAALAVIGFAPTLVPASTTYAAEIGRALTTSVENLHCRRVGLARKRTAVLTAPQRAVAAAIRDIVRRQAEKRPYLNLLETELPIGEAKSPGRQ